MAAEMTNLSDRALDRLRAGGEAPDLRTTRYRLLDRVARGGMGVVYAAEDTKLERRVALKLLDLPDVTGELAQRLVREARVLAQLEHPGIVAVHDIGTLPDGRVFYTMKFVEGRRLDEHITSVPSLPDRLRLFLRICDPVAFAHSRHVLHRDLKPANIMVGPFGEVLVMDWGLAKIVRSESAGCARAAEAHEEAAVAGLPSAPAAQDESTTVGGRTAHGSVLGTPGFMSPEQARGEVDRLDERSDIFSLGAILRSLISTSPGDSTDGAGEAPLPRALAAICAKAIAVQPGDRYARVQDLAADISRYLDGLAVSAHRETLPERAVRLYRRHQWAILLIAVYLVTRVALLFFNRR
jgi:serine/threonine protein kinase